MLSAGDAAPDFTLPDAEGNDTRLSSFLGRPVVLYFYPKDHTLGCTIEAKGFRDHIAEFDERGAAVVGVSMDTPDRHCGFRDKHHLPFHLLSDPTGRVHDLYSAWNTTLFGKTSLAVRRCTFLVDGKGIVRKVWKHVNPVGHATHVIRALDALAQDAPGKNH